MINPDLKGRGLFIFSDPGGAKPLLSYIKLTTELEEFICISDRVYDFYTDFDIEVFPYYKNCAEDFIKSFKPDFIFTGTSYTSKIELEFIKFGINRGITCYSFIDHYTNFHERFIFQGTFQYPDFICVVDERAHAIAESVKLPRPMFITGNYYHEYLRNWNPVISRDEFLESINLPKSSKFIVYAPDPLTNVGGTERWGLDELTVWRSIERSLQRYSTFDYNVIVKLHPNQSKSIIIPVLQLSPVNVIFRDSLHTNTLLYYSSCMIGIFSSILLEAYLFGVPVIRCLEGLKVEDPFEDMGIGNVAKSDSELFDLIQKIYD